MLGKDVTPQIIYDMGEFAFGLLFLQFLLIPPQKKINEEVVFSSDKLSVLIEGLGGNGGAVTLYFSAITCAEDLTVFRGSYTIMGNLKMQGDASLVVDEADLLLKNTIE